jgi:hypothetical protein
MNEMFPLAAGLVVGVFLRGVSVTHRASAVAAFGLVFGFLASLISGELQVSWWFGVVDSLLVVAGTTAMTRVFRTSIQSC